MPSEAQAAAIGEILTWLEQQIREAREDQDAALVQVEQIRRQAYDLQEQISALETGVREVEPRFQPLKGLPDKINSLAEITEHLRQQALQNKAEMENNLRLIRAETHYDREERAEAQKRIEQTAAQLGLALADLAQVQAQIGQLAQSAATIADRQNEVEARVEQFGLRLERSIEVHRDLEERIFARLTQDQEERFDIVFDRLQVIGEMVKRNEDLIQTVVNERSMREELIHEVSVWRDQHNRIDERLNSLEEVTDRFLTLVQKVQGDVTVLEGRHSGLGERVAGIRRDIAEVVDHVREEFKKFNEMQEKQRRKQIQGLEQELREMKFHAFRPPKEPS